MSPVYKRQEIENSIVWGRVGPEEMELISRLQHASDTELGVIARELAKREALILPEQFEPTREERVDDIRFWLGFIVRMATCASCFGLASSLVLAYLKIDVWLHMGTGAFATRLILALMVAVTVLYYLWPWTDTSSWKRLILVTLGFVVIVAPLCYLEKQFVIPLAMTDILTFAKAAAAGM